MPNSNTLHAHPNDKASPEMTQLETKLREKWNPQKRGFELPAANRQSSMPPISRRPFVADGEVPVEVISSVRPAAYTAINRRNVAEESLTVERQAHDQTKRDLNQARLQVQDLKTALGHEELARREVEIKVRELERKLSASAPPPPKRAYTKQVPKAIMIAEPPETVIASVQGVHATPIMIEAVKQGPEITKKRLGRPPKSVLPHADLFPVEIKQVTPQMKSHNANKASKPSSEPQPVQWWTDEFKKGGTRSAATNRA